MSNNEEKPVFGPDNPHPLSTRKTELVWEGKYDEYGNRREVDVAGLAMPMQRIETIDQPRSEAAAVGQLDLFEKKCQRLDDFRNRLIWGDNKLVMASLLKEFKGKIDLIYIDPPFDVGADFTMNVPIGDGKETIDKDQSTLEMVAYRDTWGKGTDSYLHMMYERLSVMKELLADGGSIYVHCDWRVNSFLRLLMDETFGKEFYRNEIMWKRAAGASNTKSSQYPRDADHILYFTRTRRSTYERQFSEYSPNTLINYSYNDNDGRGSYRLRDLRDYSEESVRKFESEGRVVRGAGGAVNLKQYLSDKPGVTVGVCWTDIKDVSGHSDESVQYTTQKPEALIERIIKASSNEGDLVADLFCGSGTTGAVAERLGRRWIMADLGRFAIHTSRKRLIDLQRTLHGGDKPYRAFDVYNLGRYERQWWQKEQLNNADNEHRRVVLEFFKAEIVSNAPSPLLHGRKAGAFCHVDGIDSIFSRDEAKAVAKAVQEAGGRECYCLAWEFEMDLRLTTAALEQEFGVKLKLVQIPREIMEKNRKNPPPFLEVAVLDAEAVIRKADKKSDLPAVDVKLTKFLPSLAEVPSKELDAIMERAVKSGMDFIDFWAIDFDWHPDKPFNHHWQDYRTRKDRTLKTVSDAAHVYPRKGTYTICVKVVDTFGCDTSTTLEVKL